MTQRQYGLIIFVAVAVPLAAAVWFLFGAKPDRGGRLLQPDNPQITQLGQQLYGTHCAECHGADLKGQPDWRERGPDGLLPAPPHDPSGHTWHHPSAMLVELTKFGPQRVAGADYRSAMPAYEGTLSDEEIRAVLSFIKSTWPAEIRRRHNAIDAEAQH